MTQNTAMTAPAPPGALDAVELATSLDIEDASVVLALIAEVDAIFCAPAEHLAGQRPAPPAIGRALREPRWAGRSCRSKPPRPHGAAARRVDATQRSPPARLGPVKSMT